LIVGLHDYEFRITDSSMSQQIRNSQFAIEKSNNSFKKQNPPAFGHPLSIKGEHDMLIHDVPIIFPRIVTYYFQDITFVDTCEIEGQ